VIVSFVQPGSGDCQPAGSREESGRGEREVLLACVLIPKSDENTAAAIMSRVVY